MVRNLYAFFFLRGCKKDVSGLFWMGKSPLLRSAYGKLANLNS